MSDAFKIHVDALRDGRTERISEAFDPKFLEVQEEDLKYPNPVQVSGEAYLAENELVIHLNIATEAVIPCSICNDPVTVEIKIEGFYHSEPLNEIKTGLFDLTELLREMVISETPAYVECNQGKCPHRKEIQKYIKDPTLGGDTYRPFEDLDRKM